MERSPVLTDQSYDSLPGEDWQTDQSAGMSGKSVTCEFTADDSEKRSYTCENQSDCPEMQSDPCEMRSDGRENTSACTKILSEVCENRSESTEKHSDRFEMRSDCSENGSEFCETGSESAEKSSYTASKLSSSLELYPEIVLKPSVHLSIISNYFRNNAGNSSIINLKNENHDNQTGTEI